MLHSNGRSPLWVLSWTLRFPFWVYCFPQTWQEKGFSPVCVTRCLFIVVTHTNFLLHRAQKGRIFSFLPDSLVSKTYGRLDPFLTKPLETSVSVEVTVAVLEASSSGWVVNKVAILLLRWAKTLSGFKVSLDSPINSPVDRWRKFVSPEKSAFSIGCCAESSDSKPTREEFLGSWANEIECEILFKR